MVAADREISASQLKAWAAAVGVIVNDDAAQRIVAHWDRVQAVGRTMNLTSLCGASGFVRLVVDSLTAARVYEGQSPAVDVGSGAGYPGLPLAALYPKALWWLVESVGKKARFLDAAVRELSFGNVRVRAERAEVLAGPTRERCQFAVARAVGSLAMVAELTVPLVQPGGTVLLMRGPEGRREAGATSEFLRRLGARVHRLDELDLPEGEGHRVLVVLEKVSATPAKFPRQGGQLGRLAP